MWMGCDFAAWVQLLWRNRFAVHRSRWRVAALVTAASLFHSALRLAQFARYGRRVARTRIRHAPVFIIGHWRTGTTHLHELLARDPRHACPTTYECFLPHHFLVSRSWLPRLLAWLVPGRRPMDNVAAGWERPQEDEIALCLLGLPSPYERLAFPNHSIRSAANEQGRWEAGFARLVRALTVGREERRLILKSPPHAERIAAILELYPDARFLHIVRDPYVVYPSTLNLWRVLYAAHALHRPTWEGLPEQVFADFERMHRAVEAGKQLIPPRRFHELRYEDLTRDPLGQLEELYRALELGDFALARPHVESYLAGLTGYETNRYTLTPEECREITRRWGAIIQQHGYPIRTD
jgi:hypothetical protein